MGATRQKMMQSRKNKKMEKERGEERVMESVREGLEGSDERLRGRDSH